MSTRCQVGFYEKEDDPLENWEALIYRHSDGYPDGANGVIVDLYSFLKEFLKERGVDPEYCAAHFLAEQIRIRMEWVLENEERRMYAKYTGFGVCKELHGDIEFYYAVYPGALKVYEVKWKKRRPYNLRKMKYWKLIKEISLEV